MARRRETKEERAARERVDWNEVRECVKENELKLHRAAVEEAERRNGKERKKAELKKVERWKPVREALISGRVYVPAPMPKDEDIDAVLEQIARNRSGAKAT